jgi:large subunit ribosomal protein L45
LCRYSKAGGWAKIDWELLDFEDGTPETLQGRVVQSSPGSNAVGFVQFTVRFRTRQTYAVYDKSGRLVAGTPGEVLNVEDIWVFERGLKLPNPRWR